MNKFIIFFSLFFSLFALAQKSSSDAGNGGDGILITVDGKERAYVLDGVEAGVHKNLYYANPENFSIPVRDAIIDHLEIDENVANLLAAKIYEIDKVFPLYAALMKEMLFELNWNFVSDLDLIDVKDHGDTVLKYKDNQLVQLAVRRGLDVFVDKELWTNSLDLPNKPLLVFHEVNYALTPFVSYQVKLSEEDIKLYGRKVYDTQDGSIARSITGKLFAKRVMEDVALTKLTRLFKRQGFGHIWPGRGDEVLVSKSRIPSDYSGTYGFVTTTTQGKPNYKYYLKHKTIKLNKRKPIKGLSLKNLEINIEKFNRDKYDVYGHDWVPTI